MSIRITQHHSHAPADLGVLPEDRFCKLEGNAAGADPAAGTWCGAWHLSGVQCDRSRKEKKREPILQK